VAHATGIGFVDPPGLKTRNFKTDASGYDGAILLRLFFKFLTLTGRVAPCRFDD
jgi:hypothetical protein